MMTPIEIYAGFLEELTADSVSKLSNHVTSDVHFVDPFNNVVGVDHMARVFSDMFTEVGPVRFTVTEACGSASSGMLAWQFKAELRGKPWTLEGTTVLRFASDGRVCEHIDHWDAAGQFYERLPVIGWLLGVLRRRLATR